MGEHGKLPKFAAMSGSINVGLTNLQKWYHKTDDTDVYFVCLGDNTVSLDVQQWH